MITTRGSRRPRKSPVPVPAEWGNRPSDLPTGTEGRDSFWGVLAYFIECACPPDRRSATVGAGDMETVEDFLNSYPLTHIVCGSCDSYYRLIGFIDESGVERSVDRLDLPEMESTRRGRRAAANRLLRLSTRR